MACLPWSGTAKELAETLAKEDVEVTIADIMQARQALRNKRSNTGVQKPLNKKGEV